MVSFGNLLRDPFVLIYAGYLASIGAALGLIAALALLWRTDLRKSVPMTAACTIALAGCLGPLGPRAVPITLVGGVVIMVGCHSRFSVTKPATL